ncbi:UDP-4-amino-4,6-dideoxy-N-acetyl-beta-L-altrosamine transaminase [Alphaproteobacteria bacterium]|nr:UDP-4-amino-4,6-dideoxy-N-acetyl-beta-L-altrosamine transaminase [Alphaproteobacteria bacterium]
MSRIVITGGSGLLGLNWALRTRKEHDVHLWLNQRDVVLDGTTNHYVNLSDPSELAKALDDIKPDLVIHTAGYTSVEGCEEDPERSKHVNQLVAHNVAKATSRKEIKLVHISTDHLFDGSIPLATEDTITSPLNIYAVHKANGENEVLAQNPEALVLRTTFFGWGPSYRRSFSDIILDDLRAGRQIYMFDDVFFTPLHTSQIVDLAHQLVRSGQTGVVNLCSGKRVSKYDFSVKMANAMGFDGETIQPIQAKRKKTIIQRPYDLSLSDDKLCKILNRPSISIDETIQALKSSEEDCNEIKRLGKVIPYGKHYIDDDDVQAVSNTLKSGWLTQGPAIPAFEERIAAYVGAKYAVAVSSATAGLHLSYLALGMQPGRTVLTSPITFVSTANAAYYCGGKARFADINLSTANIDYDTVSASLNQHDDIQIVAPVLFGGATEGVSEVAKLSKEKGKFVVEDAAHGLGGSYACGAKVGSCKYSDCTVFSLHPVKSIAAGEGGIITTNDKEIYKALLCLRSHGINKMDEKFINTEDAYTNGEVNIWYYEMATLGYHYRFTDIQASLANSQLNKLDAFVARRRELAHRYEKELKNFQHIRRAQKVNIDHSANHLFSVAINFDTIGKTRNQVMKSLRKDNIVTQVHYIPLVNQPFYQAKGHSPSDYPNSQDYFSQVFSLPLYYGLSDADFNFVIEKLHILTELN